MSNTTTFSDDEGLEVLHSNLAQLDPVFGLFILSVNDQVGTPLCRQGMSLFHVTTCRTCALAHTNFHFEVFWKLEVFM